MVHGSAVLSSRRSGSGRADHAVIRLLRGQFPSAQAPQVNRPRLQTGAHSEIGCGTQAPDTGLHRKEQSAPVDSVQELRLLLRGTHCIRCRCTFFPLLRLNAGSTAELHRCAAVHHRICQGICLAYPQGTGSPSTSGGAGGQSSGSKAAAPVRSFLPDTLTRAGEKRSRGTFGGNDPAAPLFYFATTFFTFCQPTTLPVFFFEIAG